MAERFAGYDVLDKWDGPSFDDVTRAVLSDRIGAVPERRFLTLSEWDLLEVLAEHLIPQPERARPIPVVPWIDSALAEGTAAEFRRVGEPNVDEVWRTGIAAIDAEARRQHGPGFVALDPAARDSLLRDIQAGEVSAGWLGVAPHRLLIEIILTTMAGIYYSHPDAWSEIGFGGPASPRGYVRLQLGRRDPWEADEA